MAVSAVAESGVSTAVELADAVGATAADVSQLKPLFDRVLVQVAEAKAASKGGVLLPGAPRVACAALASRR